MMTPPIDIDDYHKCLYFLMERVVNDGMVSTQDTEVILKWLPRQLYFKHDVLMEKIRSGPDYYENVPTGSEESD